MSLMGEMVLVRNQVLQFSNQAENLEFSNLSKRLNVVTSEIQGELMKTRMQPIGNIFSKFTRVVRDLSNELKKQIALHIEGSQTELDKSLLEAIKDPLTHIVRNSCDHGIEIPSLRKQSNKPEQGQITIRAYHEGGQVVVEVSDDGKGLKSEDLLRKAIEKGMITEAQSSQMSEKEIFNLIFEPGFSTAAKITNVSGRGVGMDVVRTNIERIGGTVDLSSVAGRGTTIRIKIPLTLAIVPALVVTSGENIFAIPQVKLVELVRVDDTGENKIEYLQGAPVYRLRGRILPLVDLNQVLDVKTKSSQKGIVNVAVLNGENCSFGLIVDAVQDTADIVVKPLNRLLKSLQVYAGGTVLGDGSVALILDVIGLAKAAQVGKENQKSAKEIEAFTTNTIPVSEVQDYLLIGVNSPTTHAIVLNYVHRLEEFSWSEVETTGENKVIRYRNAILPLISASEILGYGDALPEEQQRFPVIVVERGGKLFGIQVNKIIDTYSTDIETVPALSDQPGIYGNLSAKDQLIVVVDPFELICQAFPKQKTVAVRGAKTEPLARRNPDSQIRILLAEDTPFFRRAIASVLEGAGYDVIVATNGQEALEILDREGLSIDLVISDIEMPKMNGFELATAVRANEKTSKLPMLAISSRADKSYVQKGVAAGFNMYIEKLKSEVLLVAIRELVAAERGAA